MSVGGGFTNAGIVGSYFNSTDLSANGTNPVLFTRSDVRIDFDWGDNLYDVGGSSAPGFRDIGRDNFSISWDGQIIPRFTETYTFEVDADDGARLYLRLAGTTTWTPIISAWTTSGVHTGTYSMVRGETYDLRLEYREVSGSARVRLLWSSPSTPKEVIDPLHRYGYNCHENSKQTDPTWTDLMRSARAEWEQTTTDADGWPVGDGNNYVLEGVVPWDNAGDVYQITFTGQANVSFSSASVSTSYDAASNTTTGTISMNASGTTTGQLYLSNTRRTPGDPLGSGVTNIKIMREIPGESGIFYDPGELFNRGMIDHVSRFTFLRVNLNNSNHIREWDQRTLPSTVSQWGPRIPSEFNSNWRATSDGICWEYRVMWANHSGRDLYINIPHAATGRSAADTESYIYKLAKLLRYGSDGVEPYSSHQANPVFPPLNPNLNVYIEYSNEVPWNTRYDFSQSYYIPARVKQMFEQEHPDTAILNYEGETVFNTSGELTQGWRWSNRFIILRTVQIGDIFRSIWGEAAWKHRLFTMIHTQYGNINQTASLKFNFLEDYYNNADGITHVANPKPANYYVHASGGAFYYGPEDGGGQIDTLDGTNASMESPVISGPIAAAPSAPGWTFSGDAGFARRVSRSPAVQSETLGGTATPANEWVGFQFTVGSAPITVYELGRWVAAGNTDTHEIRLIRASDGVALLTQVVDLDGAGSGDYLYAAATADPVTLTANTSYYLLCQEFSGSDTYYNASTAISPASGITIGGSASAQDSSGNPGTVTVGGTPNRAFGPVNLRFALTSEAGLPNPDPRDGDQMLYLGTGGSASLTVTFPAEQSAQNAYALSFLAKMRYTTANTRDYQGIVVLVDGVNVTAGEHVLWIDNVPSQGVAPGIGWGAKDDFQFRYYTGGFFVEAGSTHTITLKAGVGSSGRYIFVDDLILASTDQMFGSGSVGQGSATGLVNTADSMYGKMVSQALWSHCYGFELGSYEGMFNIGGDFGQNNFGNWAKYEAPQMRDLHEVVLETLHEVGMTLPCHGTYTMLPSGHDAQFVHDDWSIPVAIDNVLQTLPSEATWGEPLPTRLRPSDLYNQRNAGTDGIIDSAGGWIFWSVLAPITDTYDIVATVEGSGSYVLEADGIVIASGSAGTPLSVGIDLTAGQHPIRVRSTSVGALTVQQIEISSDELAWNPDFSVADGNYIDPQSVAITSQTPGAEIWYTTNGDEPVQNGSTSILYTSPIAISQDTTLKARAYGSGLVPSSVASAVYTIGPYYEGFDGEPVGWYSTGSYDTGTGLSFDGLPVSGDGGTELNVDLAPWTMEQVDSGVVWASYLFFTNSTSSNRSAGIRFRDGSTIRFAIGFEHWWNEPDRLGIRNWSNNSMALLPNAVIEDQTQLVVARIDYDQGRIDVWLDPDLTSEPATPGDVSMAGFSAAGLTFSSVAFNTDRNDESTLDEIRIGRTWAQVTGASAPPPSSGDLLVHEGFDGSALGFTNHFPAGNDTGLTFTDSQGNTLVSTGGAFSGSDQASLLDTSYDATTHDELWLSLLLQITAGQTADWRRLQLGQNITSTVHDWFGPYNRGDGKVFSIQDSVGPSKDNSVSTGFHPGPADGTFLVVMQIDYLGERINMWINPILGGTTPGASIGTATFANTSQLPVSEMAFNSLFIRTDTSMIFDEIRLGTTFAAVTPLEAVPSGPVITGQPTSATVKEGANITLSVSATGSGLSYQWQRTDVGGGSSWADIAGATASSLSFTNVVASDARNYRVIVSDNQSNTVTSDVTTLTVDLVPRITTISLPNASSGQAYTYALTASSGTGALSWSLAGGSLPAGLSLNSDGVINGIPVTTGTATVAAMISDIDNDSDTEWFDLTVTQGDGSGSGAIFFEADGLVSIEAEHATTRVEGTGAAVGIHWQDQSDTTASGAVCVVALPNTTHVNTWETDAGARLDFEVDFATTGAYRIHVRMLGPNGDDDSVRLGVDGTILTTGGVGVTTGTAWSWQSASSTSVQADFTVSTPGVHTINVWMRENGTLVDKLVITTGSAPSGSGPNESDFTAQ